MIIVDLYPRCPFDNEDEKLKIIYDTISSLQPKSMEERRELTYKYFPEYREYQYWLSLRETTLILLPDEEDFFIDESEFLRDSEEWKEFENLREQLIEIQEIPYDSPEWQAVIEKYRRKDNDEE
ncbi:MAG: hypothetical protein IJF84_01585 [Thermoguttaceae bacterium]|nr:hypothetical protein [Thermoguttaceae bacterium]